MCDRFAHKVTETNREKVTYCIDMQFCDFLRLHSLSKN